MLSASAVRRLAFLWLIALLGCGGAQGAAVAPATEAEASAEDAERAVAHPFVWRVEGESGPSYMLGTIHVGFTLEDALPRELMPSVEGARVVMLEADASPGSLSWELIEGYALSKEGPTLNERLTEAQWAKLREELAAVGLHDSVLMRMRPWLPTITLMISRAHALPEVRAAVEEGEAPAQMDGEVLRGARDRDQPLRFLETPEDQIAILAGIDDDAVMEWLAELLDEPDAADETLTEMLAAYRRGDLEAVERLALDPETAAQHPEYLDAMLAQRNRAWMPTLLEELRKGGAFVAVGVGHFVGEEGLLALLASEGVEASRVPPRR